MTRPKPPRLPELAGMTEAGFNRVVAMIQPWDFWAPHRCDRPWGWNFPCGKCATCQTFVDRYNEWRASLPKTRNKKQRKAANVQRWTEEDIRKLHEPSAEIDAFFELANSVPVVDGPLVAQPSAWTPWTSPLVDGATPRAESWGPSEATPLQRLQQFAADTGVPVSFEIAEKAMKGGG